MIIHMNTHVIMGFVIDGGAKRAAPTATVAMNPSSLTCSSPSNLSTSTVPTESNASRASFKSLADALLARYCDLEPPSERAKSPPRWTLVPDRFLETSISWSPWRPCRNVYGHVSFEVISGNFDCFSPSASQGLELPVCLRNRRIHHHGHDIDSDGCSHDHWKQSEYLLSAHNCS